MRRDPTREGCAAESRARGEALLATASRERRWLLVEQPGAWGHDALTESHLPAGVAAALDAAARAHRVRVLLVRRSPGPATSGPRSVFLAHTDRTHRWAEHLVVDRPEALADLDLAVLDRSAPPGLGEPVRHPLHLVCTNGRHDPCCADWGRPVHRALRAAGIDAWECSHVGGDRFAANVVCLPTGVYLGRVPPERAAAIVTDHDDGLLDLDCYRGRCFLPPLVQAAEVLARHELGERRLDQLSLVEWDRTETGATVVLARDSGTMQVEVSRSRSETRPLTCGPAAGGSWAYRLDRLRA